jgi:glycosyltransferase involved in cell wall biosynthesis
VLIVNNMAPFVWGGAEELASHLRRELARAGHDADLLRIPFQWEPAARIPSQMLLARALAIESADRVIALKFPAYLVRHPHKTIWLLHQYRQAYDMYGTEHSNLRPEEGGDRIRRLIAAADGEAFGESRRIFTNSEVTRRRLGRYNGVDGEVLLPPLNDPDLFGGGPSEGYVFVGGRVNLMKRQHLIVEALTRAPDVRAVIAGPPDTPDDADRLRKLVEANRLQDRVRLELRFLPRSELAALVNHALAVAYLPYDEDSLGYVAMEGAAAAKALITTTDSGGVRTLVVAGQTGWVAEPTPDAIADALRDAVRQPRRTADMGRAARDVWTTLDLTWPATIGKLIA